MNVNFENVTKEQAATLTELYAALKEPGVGIGEFSDGYHTFNELYHHRSILFASLCNAHPDIAWKSKKHDTGDMYSGMFIVGIQTPDGQATYHYNIDPYWEIFKVPELEAAPKYDGHTPVDALDRISKLSFGLKEYDPNLCHSDNLQTIKVTLMCWEFVGHVYMKLGGNCKGRSLLDFDFDCESDFDTPSTHNDCNLHYHENGDFFSYTLRDAAGNELEGERDASEMNDLITGIEIIAVEPED
ncbi:MAG: DUF5406 family protein [Lachnospiraceae bacterium]|nr:DUF5406 family protein [Lachnospiraceae bacterium]